MNLWMCPFSSYPPLGGYLPIPSELKLVAKVPLVSDSTVPPLWHPAKSLFLTESATRTLSLPKESVVLLKWAWLEPPLRTIAVATLL